MNKKDLIELREGLTADHDLIYSTWLKGMYFGSKDSWIQAIPEHVFNKNYAQVIHKLLDKSQTLIACLKESPDVVLGYSVFNKDKTVIHWVYVKTSWRNIKLAEDLIPHTIHTATHITPSGKALARTYGIEFNPFAL